MARAFDVDPWGVGIGGCKKQFNSRYVANLLGEYFVRRHFNLFEPYLTAILKGSTTLKSLHRSVGMRLADSRDAIEFAIHCSLIARVSDIPDHRRIWSQTTKRCSSESLATEAQAPVVNNGGAFRSWLSALPVLGPREMSDLLAREGYVGQETARTAVCLMAYRHVKRLRQIYLEGVPREQLPPKQNMLLMGPTGCGKTYLVELLFRKILKLPTLIVDITSFTESGYVGDSVPNLVTRLVEAASQDVERASVGIICLDEFDKIAGSQSRAAFGGQGTTKDVSGYGVQRELLKMVEAGNFPSSRDDSGRSRTLNTRDVPFIACGAFSGFQHAVSRLHAGVSIGFGVTPGPAAPHGSFITQRLDEGDVMAAANFAEYGMLPELMGRFARVVPLQPMGREELLRILRFSVVEQYRKELAAEGIGLDVPDTVLHALVAEALITETGARGIGAVLSRRLERACFDAYSTPGKNRTIRLLMDGSSLVCELACVSPRGKRSQEIEA